MQQLPRFEVPGSGSLQVPVLQAPPMQQGLPRPQSQQQQQHQEQQEQCTPWPPQVPDPVPQEGQHLQQQQQLRPSQPMPQQRQQQPLQPQHPGVKAFHAYRQAQYQGPHPGLAAQHGTAQHGTAQQGSSGPMDSDRPALQNQSNSSAEVVSRTTSSAEAGIVPDMGRAILHFDVDSFYAQVDENRNPALRGRAIGG